MKLSMRNFFVSLAISLFLTSCATIFGGSYYNASILVNGSPKAEIVRDGLVIGNGSASVKVKRNMANRFSLIIREKGCEEQNFNYTLRTFRGWALVGSIVIRINGIPYGVLLDLATGAFWKPNMTERGIVKHNYKNYQYIINYTGCESKIQQVTPAVSDKLVDVVYLKNGSIIRGTLIDQDPTTHVKIQTADGSLFVFKIEEIEKVTRE